MNSKRDDEIKIAKKHLNKTNHKLEFRKYDEKKCPHATTFLCEIAKNEIYLDFVTFRLAAFFDRRCLDGSQNFR